MSTRPRGATLLLGLALATSPTIAWSDTLPEEALFGDWLANSVEITGVAQFPDHVFYLYPTACTVEQTTLENDGDIDPRWDYDPPGDPDWKVLTDGSLTSWIGKNAPCRPSRIHALARDVAETIDLGAMTAEARRDFFDGEPRLFRSDFVFMDNPLYGPRGTRLRSVREVVHVLRITPEELRVVLRSSTYRFDDTTEQTLLLSHTRRPQLPFRPMKPEKVAKYADTHAKWEARQPPEPPPPPRRPEGAEEALAEAMTTGDGASATAEVATIGATGEVATIGTTGATEGGTTDGATTGASDSPGPSALVAGSTGVAAPLAPAAVPEALPSAPVAAAATTEDVPEDMSEEPGGSPWLLRAAVAGILGLVAIAWMVIRRRR